MPIGKCPLCLFEKELVRSHLIPAAVYDYCRTEKASPVRVGNGVIMPTDRQLQAYLLCAECEDILNKGGEAWVTPKLATIQKTFPLYDLLMDAHVAFKDDKSGVYFASGNPKISCEKLTHFALGIYRKAAVHSWEGQKKEPLIQLGPYTETIRTWLRNESQFPRHVALTVTFARPETALIILCQPVEAKPFRWRTHILHVPGVFFSLHLGKAIEPEMRMTCFHQNPTHPVFVADDITAQVNAHFARDFAKSRRTKAYLKQKTENV